MKEIKEYQIVPGSSYGDLVEIVNSMSKYGWQPLGGPIVDRNNFWFQGIVKYETEV